MIKLRIVACLGAILLLQSPASWSQSCSNREYATFKQYDAFLDANPNIDDDRARAIFAASAGMRPTALKDLYFRCLTRLIDIQPKTAKKTVQDVEKKIVAEDEKPLTLGHSCNTLGFRYGYTAASAMFGEKPKAGWDFVMPERCKNDMGTELGIKAGANATSK